MKTLKLKLSMALMLWLSISSVMTQNTKVATKEPIKLLAEINGQDTLYRVFLRDFIVFPKYTFKNKEQEKYYWKTVHDVKRALPFAKLVAMEINQMNIKISKIPSEKEKKKCISEYEKNAFKKYEADLKKLNFNQSQLLLRLIDRECNKSSYELIKTYKGGVTAFFWQGFARVLGSNLKTGYDKDGNDKIIERVIVLVESGQL